MSKEYRPRGSAHNTDGAVTAARADLGLPPEEGMGSEVLSSPSELGCTSKDLKERNTIEVVKIVAKLVS